MSKILKGAGAIALALSLFVISCSAALEVVDDTDTGWGALIPLLPGSGSTVTTDTIPIETEPYLPDTSFPGPVEKPVIGSLIYDMFSSFSTVISGFAEGVKSSFLNLLFDDPYSPDRHLSGFAKFSFVLGGLALALGLGYVIILKIGGK